MSVPDSGSSALRTARAAFWCRRCLGLAVRRREGFFQEGDADALGAADFLQDGRRPRLAFHHFREQGQPHGDDLALLGQPLERLVRGTAAVRWLMSPPFSGKAAEGPAEGRQHLLGMADRKEIDGGTCSALRPSRLPAPA